MPSGPVSLKLWKSLVALLVVVSIVAALIVVPTLRLMRQRHLDLELIAAVQRNDAASVQALLRRGADANARVQAKDAGPVWRQIWDQMRGKTIGSHGLTALLVALEPIGHRTFADENVPLIVALLDHGANVNSPDSDGWLPLDLAIFSRKNDSIHLLLKRGADVRPHPTKSHRAVGSSGQYIESPIVNACRVTQVSSAEVADLLDHGSNINEQNGAGETSIYTAVTCNRADVVRLLLERHADISIPDKFGHTIIDYIHRFHDAPQLRDIVTLIEAESRKLQARQHIQGVGNSDYRSRPRTR